MVDGQDQVASSGESERNQLTSESMIQALYKLMTNISMLSALRYELY